MNTPNQQKSKCIFCTGEADKRGPMADISGDAELWRQHQYHSQNQFTNPNKKVELSECCGAKPKHRRTRTPIGSGSSRYMMTGVEETCSKCHKPFHPIQEREEKCICSHHVTESNGEKHYRDCPLFTLPPQDRASWEEEFDSLYGDDFDGGFKDKLKYFIHSLISSTHKEMTKKIAEIIETGEKMKRSTENETMKEGVTRYSRSAEQFNLGISKMQNLLSSLNQLNNKKM